MPESVAILLWSFMAFLSASVIVCGAVLCACHASLAQVGRTPPVRRAPGRIARAHPDWTARARGSA